MSENCLVYWLLPNKVVGTGYKPLFVMKLGKDQWPRILIQNFYHNPLNNSSEFSLKENM